MTEDYRENTEKLIRFLGGSENIISVTNCMTRLRAAVRDEAAVDEAGIRSLADVMRLVHDRENYYEIVVGPGKSRNYADRCHALGLPAAPGEVHDNTPDWKKNKEEQKMRHKGGKLKNALKTVGDIFVPLIPGIITAGLCAGFAALIAQAVPGYADSRIWSILYQLLTLVNMSAMTYLTAWAGYRAGEVFGASPILGGMLGMITSMEGVNGLSQLLGLYDAEAPLNSVLRAGKGGILSVILGVFLLSRLERRIRARMPESLDVIFTPLLTLLICTVPYILLIMPALGYVSGGIVWIFGKLCMSPSPLVRMITGYVSAAVFLPLVSVGMHHGLVALYSVQLQELGYVTLYPAFAMAGAGQVGAALALWIKAKNVRNRKLCEVIAGALPAGVLGIGEPLIYGVTLPLGRSFLTAGLGAGFGGALVMLREVASTTWGPSGILGLFVMTAGPRGALSGTLSYLAGLILSCIAGFLITALTYPERDLRPGILRGEDISQLFPADGFSVTLAAPADGTLIPMAEIPDPVFGGGTMGPCIGIMPENGVICAPCDGTVSFIAETGHAMSITAEDGTEFLIHAGLDTVNLKGRGFTLLTGEGASVSKGEKVLEADLDVIRAAGLSPIIILASPEN